MKLYTIPKRALSTFKNLYWSGVYDLKPIVPPYYPRSVYVEPTNRCVLKCKFCMHNGRMTRDLGFMDFELYKKIIDDIKNEIKQVDLLGQGEPLLHKDIVKMVEYAKENNLRANILTNGVLLTEGKMNELVKAGLDNLHISFDCANKDLWIKYKGGTTEAYERTYKNVLKAIEIVKEHGHPRLGIYLIKYGENINHIKEHLDFWNHKLDGIGNASVQDLINMWGLNDDDPSLGWYRELTKEITDNNIGDKDFPVCFSPWVNCVIYWDGRVNASTYDANGRMIVGDVKEDSFLDIWKNEKFKQYRKWCVKRIFDDNGINGVICKKCNLLLTPEDNMPLSLKGKMKLAKYKFLHKKDQSQRNTKTLDDIFVYAFRKRAFILKSDKNKGDHETNR